MKMHTLLLAGAFLIPLGAVAQADDHLFEAQQHGLSQDSKASSKTHAFTTNKAGHSGKLAPGQGSPFSGHDTKTPATDTDAANNHAHMSQH